MKKIITIFAVIMAATLLLTSLVFSQYPHEKAKGKDSVLYIDGEGIYNLSDLRGEQYDGKIGHFTLEGKTYFALVNNSYDPSILSFKIYVPEDFVLYGSEDLQNVYEVDYSNSSYNSSGYHLVLPTDLSPRHKTSGYVLFIFHTLPYEIAPDDPEVELVKGQLADGTIPFSLEPPEAAA